MKILSLLRLIFCKRDLESPTDFEQTQSNVSTVPSATGNLPPSPPIVKDPGHSGGSTTGGAEE